MEIFTIGVYGSTESTFFDKLINSKIDTFIDVRQRRGVRGSKYSFVNSIKLQEKLKNLNINYIHEFKLSPSTDIRELQKNEDLKKNELKRDRNELGNLFVKNYNSLILEKYDFNNLIETLEKNNRKNIVFFCVEENFNACHRSLIINKLRSLYNFNTVNL